MSINLNVNEQQFDAIHSRNTSILVSAPAGSGKTKVLVDRIMSMLLIDKIDINQILVLTFTSPAAAEMKQRLQNALYDELEKNKDHELSSHIHKQLKQLPNAYITNFHSFCSTLLKQYGDIIDINTDFNILSKKDLIIDNIINQCIDEWLKDDTFLVFIELNFNDNNLTVFKNTLLKLYNYKSGTYNYNELIQKTRMQSGITNIEKYEHYNYLNILFKESIDQMHFKLNALYEFTIDNGLTSFYQNDKDDKLTPFDSLLNLVNKIRTIFESNGVIGLQNLEIKAEKSSTMSRKEAEDKSILTTFDNLKKDILKPFKELLENVIATNQDLLSKGSQLSFEYISYFDSLIEKLELKYNLYKKELNYLDFNDLEQKATMLLEPQHGIAALLHHNLKEIMVDEYQDTNLTQETLLLKISKSKKPEVPLFMVGDMKQSIYRFRNADPMIFKSKYDTFGQLENTKKIDLVYNYRSNKIVLDSINYIFHQIMDSKIGGLEYINDPKAPLNYDYIRKEKQFNDIHFDSIQPKVDKRINELKNLETEILLATNNEDKVYTKAELEAIMVANRIKDLISYQQLETNDYSLRKCEYKDIVVLMRNSTNFMIFKKIFDNFDIPNNIVLNAGFYRSNEIVDSIMVLDTIYNPHNDIAWLSLLTGNYTFSNFDENLILDIKNTDGFSYYSKTINYLITAHNHKLQKLIDWYNEMVLFSKDHSIYEVYNKFIDDSSYLLFVSGLFNGNQRSANIELFFEKLKSFNEFSYEFAMNEIINDSNLDKTAPATSKELTSNEVTFMTTHKSKGLEFPVVFISGLSSQFNQEDLKSKILTTPFGFSTMPNIYHNIDNYKNIIHTYENPIHYAYREYDKQSSIDEELRILYVALTRASQKLICTGHATIDKIIKLQEEVEMDIRLNSNQYTHNAILQTSTRKVNNCLDWLLKSIIRHPDFINQCFNDEFLQIALEKNNDKLKNYSQKIKIYSNQTWPATKHSKFKTLIYDANSLKMNDNDLEKEIQYISALNTSHDILPLPKSIAVTREIEHQTHSIQYDNQFKLSIPSNEFGTIIHEILEKISFKSIVDVEDEIVNLKGFYNENIYQDVLNYSKYLQAFFDSKTYQDIINSDYIYKEKSISYINESNQIIHGILDLVYIKDNKINILDYKTDKVLSDNSDESLHNLHMEQLNYYKKVLESKFPNHQITASVYYLHINKIIFIR